MKIAIISKRRIFSKYVIDTICQNNDVVGIFLEKRDKFAYIRDSIKKSDYKKLCVEITNYLFGRINSSTNFQKRFFRINGEKLIREDLVYETEDINSKTVSDKMKELNLDLIVDYGSSILKSPIINMPKLGVINLHTGILPYYRGTESHFWALFNKEPERVGVTIHQLNDEIDKGRIIARAIPEFNFKDKLVLIECRCIELGTDLLLEVLEKFKTGDIKSSEQQTTFRYYPLKDKTILKEIKFFLLKRAMNDIHINEKILWSNGEPILQ